MYNTVIVVVVFVTIFLCQYFNRLSFPEFWSFIDRTQQSTSGRTSEGRLMQEGQ